MRTFDPPAFTAAFGLAFDIEKAPTKSGYQPALTYANLDLELFGKPRLDGFADLIRTNYVDDLYIVGGNEARYKGETIQVGSERIPINRAYAIREMLVHDRDIDPKRVHWLSSVGNTGGNVAVITENMDGLKIHGGDEAFLVTTSHYHLPRAMYDLFLAGRRPVFMSAEAFTLAAAKDKAEQQERKLALIKQLGGGPLASTMAQEINGLADKLNQAFASASS